MTMERPVQDPTRAAIDAPSAARDSADFRCARCGGVLRDREAGLDCTACGTHFPRHDDIVDFRLGRRDYYFNPVPRREMERLIAEAPTAAWDATVRRFMRFVKNVPDWIDNVGVNGRYAWKLFLELPPGARVLDFGCGLGNLTQNVAPHVGEMVALDLTWERLRFAQQRFARFNAQDRITVVAGGDGPHLPFPDGHFDAVVLSGVLEWIGDDIDPTAIPGSPLARAARMMATFFGSTNPRQVQLRFLRELRRIVKPAGQLFVAIENRWGYEYFRGRPDHHSGLLYGSLLPRALANAYSIVRTRRPYRTYTYSLPGARSLFARAGFERQTFLGMSPGYSKVREVLPLFRGGAWRPRAPGDMRQRIKRSRYFVPAFGIIAGAAGERASLLDRLLRHILAALPVQRPLVLAECVVSAKEKIVLKGTLGNDPVVLKLPVEAAALRGETVNADFLAQREVPDAVARLRPAPLARGTFQGLAYFLETAVRGVPLSTVIDAGNRAAMAGAVRPLLAAMARAGTARETKVASSERLYVAAVADPLARLAALDVAPAAIAAIEADLGGMLTAQAWRRGLQHGDFSNDNVFVMGGAVSGLIDWEGVDAAGLTVLDALGYLESTERHVHGGAFGDNLARLASRDWRCREELDLLDALYRDLGIDPALHPRLCRLSWLYGLGVKLSGIDRFDPRFVERWVQPMLPHFGVTA